MKKILTPENTALAASLLIFVITGFGMIYPQDDAMKKSMARGKSLYMSNCSTCHMPNGEGIKGTFPPVAKSDYMMEDLTRSIREILYGVSGEMTVNGVKYNGVMNAYNFTDLETADVLNYIRNSWGNSGQYVSAEKVKSARK